MSAKLAFFSVALFLLGAIYTFAPLPPNTASQLAVVLDIAPSQIWGIVMMVLGIGGMVYAVLHQPLIALVTQTFFTGFWTITILFGYLATLAGWVDYDITSRALAQAVTWGVFTGFLAFTAKDADVEPRAIQQMIADSLETRRLP